MLDRIISERYTTDEVLRQTNPNLLLLTAARDKGPRVPFTALSWHFSTVVRGLCDEQRRGIGLTPTLDRPARERRYVETAVALVPAKSVHVANEDLILGDLTRRWEVSAIRCVTRTLRVQTRTHMVLLVCVPDGAAHFEARACLPNL